MAGRNVRTAINTITDLKPILRCLFGIEAIRLGPTETNLWRGVPAYNPVSNVETAHYFVWFFYSKLLRLVYPFNLIKVKKICYVVLKFLFLTLYSIKTLCNIRWHCFSSYYRSLKLNWLQYTDTVMRILLLFKHSKLFIKVISSLYNVKECMRWD